MSSVGSGSPPSLSAIPVTHNEQRGDEQLDQVIDAMKAGRLKSSQIAKIDFRQLDGATRTQLSQQVAQQLRGQLPPNLAKALNEGSVDNILLGGLVKRLANSTGGGRTLNAVSATDARNAANPGLSSQALQWSQFVQATGGANNAGFNRQQSGQPASEGNILAQLIASQLSAGKGAGLRSPKLIAGQGNDLSPQQQMVLMRASLGQELAQKLTALGITDPMMLVKAGALPTDRASLAMALNIPRGRLLALLLRAEMLKVGPGNTGEMGINPLLLGALSSAGLAMLGSLSALRTLSQAELSMIYKKFRQQAGGFGKTMSGKRVPVKRDLMHWAKTAGRKRSDILLANSEDYANGKMTRGDGEEIIQAWYLENLLWDQLAERGRNQALREQKENEHKNREQKNKEQRDDEEKRYKDHDNEEEDIPELLYDNERSDALVCFWVTDHSQLDYNGNTRRMYVCVDPDSGAIIPQSIESGAGSGPVP